jgi:hypothetical protein
MNNFKIFVVAENHKHFIYWCSQNQISPTSPLLKYIYRYEDLCGILTPIVIGIGFYWENSDWIQIKDMIANRNGIFYEL